MLTWGKLRRQAGAHHNAHPKELGSLDAKAAWAALQSPDGFGQMAAQASAGAARTVATSGEAQGCVTVFFLPDLMCTSWGCPGHACLIFSHEIKGGSRQGWRCCC